MSAKQAPFLLLRGLIREQRHWGDFGAILQQYNPGADIITLDIPGNGQLYQSESPQTIAGMTEALRQQLTSAGKRGPVNLVALSMGGMIAIDWMCRYGDEINTGVLINTSVNTYSPFYQRLRWQNYLRFLALCWQSPAQKERSILALTSNVEGHNESVLKNWQLWQQQYPVSFTNALKQIRASAKFKPTQKPSQPLLVISSKADRLVDYRCSVRLQTAWQTAFAQHCSAGHDLPLDDPRWVSEVIKDWLDGLAKEFFYP